MATSTASETETTPATQSTVRHTRRRHLIALVTLSVLGLTAAVPWIFVVVIPLVLLGVVGIFRSPVWSGPERGVALLVPIALFATVLYSIAPFRYEASIIRCGPRPTSSESPRAVCRDQHGQVVEIDAPVQLTPVPWAPLVPIGTGVATLAMLGWLARTPARPVRPPP